MKWFPIKTLVITFVCFGLSAFQNNTILHHPLYVSILEIEHNPKENRLELSCKIFTNDFEATLKKNNPSYKIDLLAVTNAALMNQLVSEYIKEHVVISVDGKAGNLNFVGYEQADESIQSYFEVDGIKTVKKLTVKDNILFEYKKEQMSVVHVTVNGVRKSTKLNNPEDMASFDF